MATSQAQFPRLVRAAPDPLGWYLRPSYVDHRAIADAAAFAESLSFASKPELEGRMREKRKVLERLRVGLGRYVQEGRAESFSLKPRRRAQRG